MAEECPRSRVVDKTPPTRALCADGGGTPAQPRCRQDVADASAVLRSQGSARAAESPTGWRRCECCVLIARGDCGRIRARCGSSRGRPPAGRPPAGRSPLQSRTMRLCAGARACRVASPRRRRHGEGPFSTIMSWQHSVASGWRQESRGFLKPALLPEEFGLLTRGSGLIGDGSGNRSGRLSGPDLPALTRAP